MSDEQHTATAQVQIIHQQFEMPQLGCSRRIWLYLPKGYDISGLSYPVIYMQDGQNLFDAATASYEEWRIDEFLASLPDEQQAIVVGIDHADAGRILEYNPFDSEEGPGKGSLYAAFLAETLKPFIDENYRTLSDAAHTVVAGSSLGGLIAMYTAVKYPRVFGQAGIFSPAFWIATDLYAMVKSAGDLEASRFYFACGDAESESMVGDVLGMVDILKERGLTDWQLGLRIVEGAEHNEAQWQDDFPAFYNWLTEAQSGFFSGKINR